MLVRTCRKTMYHFFTRVLFIFGLVVGVLLAVLYVRYFEHDTRKASNFVQEERYDRWFSNNNLKRSKIPLDSLRFGDNNYFLEAQYLHDQIKVICLILVKNSKNARAANNTWARGCNRAVFVDLHMENKKMMPAKKSRENSSWVRLCKALKKVPDLYNWAVVSYDDTFVILENLRLLVAGLSDSQRYYLGHAVTFWNVQYNLGQAGYALSRGAVRAFRNKLQSNNSCLSDFTYWNQEDFYLGKHLQSLNVTPMDTRDSTGLSTFHPHNLQHAFFAGGGRYKPPVFPVKCCSAKSVTFNAIEASKFYTYHYLLYKLEIFHEGNLGNRAAPTPMPDKEVWKSFLRKRGIYKDDVSQQEYYKLWEDEIQDPTVFMEKLKRDYE